MKNAYFSIATTLFGIFFTVASKVNWYHLFHKHWNKYTTVRTFAYNISDEILNNNLNELVYEDVKTTIAFIFGLIMGDHVSNENDNSPDPDIFPGESVVLNISADGYLSY